MGLRSARRCPRERPPASHAPPGTESDGAHSEASAARGESRLHQATRQLPPTDQGRRGADQGETPMLPSVPDTVQIVGGACPALEPEALQTIRSSPLRSKEENSLLSLLRTRLQGRRSSVCPASCGQTPAACCCWSIGILFWSKVRRCYSGRGRVLISPHALVGQPRPFPFTTQE